MFTWLEAAYWALAGGLCVEGLELYARIRHTPKWSWRTPIPQGLTAYLLSVVIRAGVGATLAAAAASSKQVTGAFAAFSLGVAAPLVIEKITKMVQIPIDGTRTTVEKDVKSPAAAIPPDNKPKDDASSSIAAPTGRGGQDDVS